MRVVLINSGNLHRRLLTLEFSLLHKWNEAKTLVNVETRVLRDSEELHGFFAHSQSWRTLHNIQVGLEAKIFNFIASAQELFDSPKVSNL